MPRMDDANKPAPAGWIEALAISEAELAAGLTVPMETVLQELDDSIRRLEESRTDRRPPLTVQVSHGARDLLDVLRDLR